jgi:hypothetical protein
MRRGRPVTRAWHRGGGRKGEDGGALTWSSATASPWRYGGTAWPRQRQAMAKPGGRRSAEAPAQARRGLRPSHSTRRTGGDEIVTAHHGRVADALGANDGGGETRIDVDQRARRRAAVRLRPISPAGAAEDGRNNSASTTATQGLPELGD